MFQNKPRDKYRLFGYRWMRPYILSSGSFCNLYSTIPHLLLAFKGMFHTVSFDITAQTPESEKVNHKCVSTVISLMCVAYIY
ncbi:hypothetical protein ES703_85339 [subsurface metagenome]